MEIIIWTVALMAAVGLIGSILLLFVSRKFAVTEDERLASLVDILPGVNCGSCGFANCEQYANALLDGAATNCCSVGGDEVAAKLASALGLEACATTPRRALVACRPLEGRLTSAQTFQGEQSCRVFSTLIHDSLACPFSCLGFGDCVTACPFDAITIEDGVAHINPSACTGCGKCVSVCPRHVISLVEQKKSPVVAVTRCNNTMLGKGTRGVCGIGCIGCRKCEKVCPAGAISVVNNLARIDSSVCTGCGKCTEVCPTGAVSLFTFQ